MHEIPVAIAWFLCLVIYLFALARIIPPMQERPASDAGYAEIAGMVVAP